MGRMRLERISLHCMILHRLSLDRLSLSLGRISSVALRLGRGYGQSQACGGLCC